MRRAIFLLHRWTAIVLGVFVFAWFVSGIALAYYPWPLLTESRQDQLLEPFQLTPADTSILGFGLASLRVDSGIVVGGRLEKRAGTLMYELWRDEGGATLPFALVDAHSGTILTPLTNTRAIAL